MAANRNGSHTFTRALAVFGAGAAAFAAWRIGLSLFGPAARYRIDRARLPAIDSDEFRDYVAAIIDSRIHDETKIDVLANGDAFYPAELEAIRAARRTINLEAYTFQEGELTRQFLDTLEERARAGVEVRMTVDAIGSWGTAPHYFKRLREAGGRLAWYHPVNSRELPYINHRTHRKLLIVDGRVGFIGGAGFADHWIGPNKYGPAWRDTMLRVEGSAVADLNSVFAENWLETTGEILAGSDQFRFANGPGAVTAWVLASTPHGGATHARTLYQILIEAAQRTINITTPYFVPDRSARRALREAAQRGVSVRILTAGPHHDHTMTRRVGRLHERPLAKAGARIYEYQPSMIHFKMLTIDGIWAVAGSTNFDHRSFDLNDEVNIVIRDPQIAARFDSDFARDLEQSKLLTLRRLNRQDVDDRVMEGLGWVLQREQ